ncbi:hypothetical protein [Chryseobacterium sp. PMSZPI]|uniref:FEKKY domain-containing protein n=1 Tax=Chryseobacterium sp. PMSZPI TaxID=1033900 RepID=UPI000C31DBB4|nr:hypothetical protein [Chryseobacterium sp. PMSZPI]PKF75781.1 hypothetical protein CW752_02440 [Chryseobacterium sp. PMSZPI]
MIRSFLFLLMITVVFACKEENNRVVSLNKENTPLQDTYFTVLGYGYPDVTRQELTYGVSEKWRIKNIDVAGCEVTQKLIDSVATENAKTFAAIEKKYGKNWKEKYEQDILNFEIKRREVVGLLNVSPLFRVQLKACNMKINEANKEIKQLKSEIYEVVVYSYDKDFKKNNCCTLRVDTKNRTVNLIQ